MGAPVSSAHEARYSLDLVRQATIDVFVPHSILLGGEGPGGGGWCKAGVWGPSIGFHRAED
jgi:hypothetical protein